ncbi:hypothetical protein PRIPAC_90491, partial [Pristionchus pacificus]
RMTDDSKFVLRWEIDNAKAFQAAEKAGPKVFYEGGFIWTAMAEKSGGKMKPTLRCGVDHSRPWKCAVNLSVRMKGYLKTADENIIFGEDNDLWRSTQSFYWSLLGHPDYAPNNTAVIEFNVHIVYSEREGKE